MSEENNNAKMSEAESTADKAKKLSEDVRGLGPRQVGLINRQRRASSRCYWVYGVTAG